VTDRTIAMHTKLRGLDFRPHHTPSTHTSSYTGNMNKVEANTHVVCVDAAHYLTHYVFNRALVVHEQ